MPHDTSITVKPSRQKRQIKGEPFVWLSGGAIATGIVMIVGILLLVVGEGTKTFWPRDIELFVVGQSRFTVVEFVDQHGAPVFDPLEKKAGREVTERELDDNGSFKGPEGQPVNEKGETTTTRPFVPLTIAQLRKNKDAAAFKGRALFLKTPRGLVTVDDRDNPRRKHPVSAWDYLANREVLPTPFNVFMADGKIAGIDQFLNDPDMGDYTGLLGTVRTDRDLDLRDIPRKEDGTPWQSYEMPARPTEIQIRQGNQGEGLYSGADNFRWLKQDAPDLDNYRVGNPAGFNVYLLNRAIPHGPAEIERLERGVLTGWVIGVYDRDKPLATVEEHGLEGVWQTWRAKQDEMRRYYLKRYDLEKHDIGHVNFKIKELEREISLIRYNNRRSGEVVAALSNLNDLYRLWTLKEPPSTAKDEESFKSERETYTGKLQEWRKTLQVELDKWQSEVNAWNLNEEQRKAVLAARAAQEKRGDLQAGDYAWLRFEVNYMREREKQVTFRLRTLNGLVATEPLAGVVRGFRPNELGLFGKIGVYIDRVHEFLTADPRESNTEGGIFMVILGTLVMTMVMSVLVVPFGVIAALYLREYAKQGWMVSMVRIAVNNLAGVPSIVFGIFGFGLFCVLVGKTIDEVFFPEMGATPTFGGGGVLWASLTLALLTVPVVIVATEEALIAVPSSQREASLACGASRFQTIRKVILPQAMPGVLTGLILAMARGAGEVAPLMIVGVVKYAPYAPVDGVPPFLHLERKFMHLGFHIYDLGFQSPNAENTKPLVFTTTLVLIALVALLNVAAITIRNRIRSKMQSSHV